jgi:hypothetical protein
VEVGARGACGRCDRTQLVLWPGEQPGDAVKVAEAEIDRLALRRQLGETDLDGHLGSACDRFGLQLENGPCDGREIQRHGDRAIGCGKSHRFQAAAIQAGHEERAAWEQLVAVAQAEEHRRVGDRDHQIGWRATVAAHDVLEEQGSSPRTWSTS